MDRHVLRYLFEILLIPQVLRLLQRISCRISTWKLQSQESRHLLLPWR